MMSPSWWSTPFAWLVAIAVVCGILGTMALFALVRALRGRRPLRAINRLLLCLVLVTGALAAAVLALALHGYDRLTTEVPVARLEFRQTGAQAFDVTLHLPDRRRLDLALQGDEWQLDARVVKWRPIAVLAGLDPVYKLDRISGRYRNLDSERSAPRSVHDLAGEREVDVWRLARRYPAWLPFLDTEFGSGAYLPMRDGTAYEVTLSPLGGLIARNATTELER